MFRIRQGLNKKRIATLILACLICTTVISPVFAETASDKPKTFTVEMPIEEEPLFNLFQDLKDIILNLYPNPVDSETLYLGAIRGLFESIDDPYSQYLDKQEYKSLSQDMEGDFSGIGVSIQLISGNVTVVSVFKSSPADKAGMQSGDVIIGVDGADIQGKGTQHASNLLRGEAGTRVGVTVFRPRTGEKLNLTMMRSRIFAHALEMEDLGDDMFYICISQFTSTTSRDFSLLMELLRRKGVKGIILDLRDNPGGLLDAAVDVASELVPRGPIVELRRKHFKQVIGSDKDNEVIPTVILVNQGSASASEIVAGAVRDRGKAILVGERTFGKASVQTMFPLSGDLGGFKLTIGEYYTPSGKAISGVGLKPNIAIEQERIIVPDTLIYDRPLREGSIGLDVLALQESLEFLGYTPGAKDGIFGPKTQKALYAFFKDYSKKPTKTVDKDAILSINGAVSEKTVNVRDKVLEEAKILLSHWLELDGHALTD